MGSDLESKLEGVCTFYTETGTEGGYWAFMDSIFITENKTQYVCKKCYNFWNKEKEPDGPLPLPPHSGDDPLLKELVKLPVCQPNEHEFELKPDNFYSYEGLHTLGNGDYLTICDPNNKDKIIWSGTINLKLYDLFTETASGYWIHADQIGIDRETWAEYFFKDYPATLIKK